MKDKAMQDEGWALERIHEAINKKSDVLDLSGVGKKSRRLVSIPPDIFLVPNLRVLDLQYNNIRTLPPEFSKLTSLEHINLRANRISEFPHEILNIPSIRALNLSHNAFETLPGGIHNLRNLEFFSIGKTNIRSLPDELWSLTRIKQLNLYSLGLSSVPDGISNLEEIVEINLRGNRISSLPSWLFSLPRLSHLVLVNNPIQIPPPEVINLSSAKKINDTVDIRSLRNYFRQIEEQGQAFNYEAKLLILGEGGAGKTTLAKKLNNPEYYPSDSKEISTEGVDIIQWEFPLPNNYVSQTLSTNHENSFLVNIWDFGGQEIYHATHQFFLTKRSVYIVVADTRREDNNFYYWFKAQETFGSDSPLILVKNKIRGNIPSPDEASLRERFPNLKASYLIDILSAPNDSEWFKFASELSHNFLSLENIGTPLPLPWVNVRKSIENDPRDTIELSEYKTICANEGVRNDRDALQLSEYLHNIGVILHFQDDPLLIDTVIIKPTWGLDAVYRVLDNGDVKINLGRFSRNELRLLWHEEKYVNKREELLRLMQKFQICYPLPSEPDLFIAPHLLSIERPDYSFDKINSLFLKYYYPKLMPKGILSRLIVLLHDIIESQTLVWRTGVVLADRHARAEVIEQRADSEIHVRVTGGNRRDLLMHITHFMERVHSPFPNLQFQKLIPCICSACKNRNTPYFYNLDELLERLANNKYTIECGVPPYKSLGVQELIDKQLNYSSIRDDYLLTKNIYAKQVFIAEKGDQAMSTTKKEQNISIGDSNTVSAPLVIADRINNSFKALESLGLESEIDNLMRSLITEISKLSKSSPEAAESHVQDMADDSDSIVKELEKSNPRKKVIQSSLEAITDTVKEIGTVATPVLSIVEKLQKIFF